MPDVDFRFWGEPLPQDASWGEVPENVRLEGPYDDVAGLDLSQVDAWLYTSGRDGVPDLLLDVAMTETPLVASMVGGVDEVLSVEDSWPVTDREDPQSYEKALREILSDPGAARVRSHALRERLQRDRTQRSYRELAARVLLDRTPPAEEAP